MNAIGIRKLQSGFVIEDDGGELVAGVSGFRDLVDWLAQWTGEGSGQVEARKSPTVREIEQLLEGINRPVVSHRLVTEGIVSPNTEERVRESMDALRDVIGEEAAGEETLPPGDDGVSDREPPIDADPQAQFEAGPEQAEPEEFETPTSRFAPTEDAYAALPINQQKVLDHLQLCAMKLGERFQLTSRILAEKAGVSKGSLAYFIGELEKKGFIRVEPQGRGVEPFYIVPVPGEEGEA